MLPLFPAEWHYFALGAPRMSRGYRLEGRNPVSGRIIGVLRGSASFRFAHDWVQTRRLDYLACSSMAGLHAAVSLLLPWIAGNVVTSPSSPWSWFVVVTLLILRSGIGAVVTYRASILVGDLAGALRLHVIRHLVSLPLSYFWDAKRSWLNEVLAVDCDRFAEFAAGTLVRMPGTIVMFVGALICMSAVDSNATVMFLVGAPLVAVGARFLARRVNLLTQAYADANSRVLGMADETLTMLPAVKAFTREMDALRRIAASVEECAVLWRRQHFFMSLSAPLGEVVALAILIFPVVIWVTNPTQDAASIAVFALYVAVLVRPLGFLGEAIGRSHHAAIVRKRLDGILGTKREQFGAGTPVSDRLASVRFDNITFAYPGREPVLQDVSLELTQGAVHLLVGKNGTGKSTLAHLLMRFLAPTEGRILLNEVDIESIELNSYRSNVSFVGQEVLLNSGSIAENIRWGGESVSWEELLRAAKLAQAHEFIDRLPRKYDTLVGREGVKLSGGQRQRLALARAFVKRAPMIVLDEPTAMFDTEARDALLAACRAFFDGRTVVIISHDESLRSLVDCIWHVNNGKIEQDGRVARRRCPDSVVSE